MNLNVTIELARIRKSLADIQSGLGTPMVVTAESSVEERVAALANDNMKLLNVVERIVTALEHSR